jgi:hypothetical protein
VILNSGSPGTLIASCFFAFLSIVQKSQLTKTKTRLWFDVSKSPRPNDSSLPIGKKLAIALAQNHTVQQLNSIRLHDRDASLIAAHESFIKTSSLILAAIHFPTA